MAFGTWGFGHYTMTYTAPGQAAINLGQIEGPRLLTIDMNGAEITSDQYGDTIIDGIYRGQNAVMQMVFKEYVRPGINFVLNPFLAAYGDDDEGKIGNLGESYCTVAGSIILSAVQPSPAYTNGPRTINAERAVIAPGTSPQVPLGNVSRDIPVTFRLLPYVKSGDPAGAYRLFENVYQG